MNRLSALPYNVARAMTLSHDVPHVQTEESEDGVAVFRIDRGLARASFSAADGYWTAHRRYQAEGRLHHQSRDCPELTQPLIGRRWTPETGWHDVAITPAGGAIPASEPF